LACPFDPSLFEVLAEFLVTEFYPELLASPPCLIFKFCCLLFRVLAAYADLFRYYCGPLLVFAAFVSE
jgi:hypothetical protein